MRRHACPLLLSVAILSSLSGCASLQHLNEPARSAMAVDVANLLAEREIPYETVEKGGLSVSYNALSMRGSSFDGYRLTLMFWNKSDQSMRIEPVVEIEDGRGFMLEPYSFDAFMAEAAAMAGVSVPASMPAPSVGSNSLHRGTVTNTTTGRTYSYSGSTSTAPSGGAVGGFAAGLVQGMANARAANAASTQYEGRMWMKWGNRFWLKNVYDIPPRKAASGALIVPTTRYGDLPLHITIRANGERFDFQTVGNLK